VTWRRAAGLAVLLAPLLWWFGSSPPSVLLWDPVTRDRRGGPEPAPVVYLVHMYRADVRGWITGPDGDLWPVYDRWQEDIRLTETSTPLPDPDPGCVVAWWDPVAVDGAGNRSDDP